MYLDLVPRSAEFSDEGSEGRGGVANGKVKEYRNKRANCLHSETSKDILDLRWRPKLSLNPDSSVLSFFILET